MITVYKKAKTGKIQVYIGSTDGDEIISEYGELNGKMQTSSIRTTPKNIGKANETSAEEQAELELAAKIQKKLDSGYFYTIEEAITMEVYLPMLAYTYEKRKGKITTPFYLQPKYDGVRCLATYINGAWHLMSRGGKTYEVAHIAAELDLYLDQSLVYDGELYIHGMPLQDLVSLVKKPKEGSENIEFHIYDVYITEAVKLDFKGRTSILRQAMYNLPEDSHLKLVPTLLATAEETVSKQHGIYIQEGFEGTIIREIHGTYELGKRSRFLLKYKEFIDEEFEIVNYEDGLGRFVGCVIWICQTSEGKAFKCVPKGSLEQKQEWYDHANDYIGKKLTVRYQALTNDNIPQFPVGIAIRDYE